MVDNFETADILSKYKIGDIVRFNSELMKIGQITGAKTYRIIGVDDGYRYGAIYYEHELEKIIKCPKYLKQ